MLRLSGLQLMVYEQTPDAFLRLALSFHEASTHYLTVTHRLVGTNGLAQDLVYIYINNVCIYMHINK